MRLIQHKREAFWFYRFLSLGYDRWVNPLFWTPAMRELALAEGRLERGQSVLDAGAGTGFTTEGIVARVEPSRDDARPVAAPAGALAFEARPGVVPAGAGGRREPPVRRRHLRPLRLGRLDRVLAGPAARHRRGLPRDARRRARSSSAPSARRTASPARWPRPGCSSPRSTSTALDGGGGLHGRARGELAPAWYRDRRAPYALAISGVKPRPGPSPAPPPAPPSRRGPSRFASRFVAGSAAGAVFIPIAVALTLRDRLAARRAA